MEGQERRIRDWRKPWSEEQKAKLMSMVDNAPKGKMSFPKIARACRHSVSECITMRAMLEEYRALGQTQVVIRDGVRVTICPPATARGIVPDMRVRRRAGTGKRLIAGS